MRISVIMGGPSAEHEISILSGYEVLKNIDRARHRAKAVVVKRNCFFYYCDIDEKIPDLSELEACDRSPRFRGPLAPDSTAPIWSTTDVALLALHGAWGEDGTVQGYLQTMGIAYTGSGVTASALSMDKIVSKHLFELNGLATPPWSVFGRNHPATTIDSIVEAHGFPCFVKCPQSGSSRLMGRAQDRQSLESLLAEFSSSADDILIESAISGDEYSCPVLEYPGGEVRPLPPILIRPTSSSYFDYRAKYTNGASEEIVPAPCSADLTKRIQEASLLAHAILGCHGLSRTDIIVQDDTLYVLELNALPGLTAGSLAPKSFAAAGGTYAELVEILVQTALGSRRGMR